MNEPTVSFNEGLANAITSGIGLVLAVAGSIILVVAAGGHGTIWHMVSCSVYAGTLVFLYAASTLYHSRFFPNTKVLLRAFDHAGIFLLIAGTYTPFALVNLRGSWGWSLFGAIWTLALVGILCQPWLSRRPLARVGLYVGMGWAALMVVKPLIAHVASGGLLLLLTGGLAYTGGIAFYGWRRLPYHHAIWHVFVIAGSGAHFFAVLLFVLPR